MFERLDYLMSIFGKRNPRLAARLQRVRDGLKAGKGTQMFDTFVAASAARWNVPVDWIRATIQTESSWNPQATGSGGDAGLMQITPSTAGLYGWDWSTIYDPEANIDHGTQLLGDLRQRYGDDYRRVYSAYNSGNPDLWETSSQVAANVERALRNLANLTVETVTANPNASALLLVAVVAWLILRR